MSIKKINRNLRHLLIKRVDGICAICLKRPYDLDAHRIVPGREEGKYTEDNIIMVCPECHRIIDKQIGLRRILLELRQSLEWILSQHRLPGKKLKIKEIRECWESRRIKSSKDHLLNDTLNLFEEFKEDENEDLSSIGIWLDDMITWRRICTGLLNLCLGDKKDLKYIIQRLKNVLDYNEDDPRYLELKKELQNIKSKKQLYSFIKNEIFRLEDYLIVQRNKEKVIGFIYFHYYFKHRYAFVSYVVLAKPKKGKNNNYYQGRSLDRLVFNGLLKNIMHNHPECEGIIMEIDPEEKDVLKQAKLDLHKKISSEKKQQVQYKRGRGLHRLFHMHYPMLKKIDVNYIQPKSFVHFKRKEKKLWILYYPLNDSNNFITKTTLEKILDFLYNYLYRDELDNLKKFDANIYISYKDYLNNLKNNIIQNSPNRIALI